MQSEFSSHESNPGQHEDNLNDESNEASTVSVERKSSRILLLLGIGLLLIILLVAAYILIGAKSETALTNEADKKSSRQQVPTASQTDSPRPSTKPTSKEDRLDDWKNYISEKGGFSIDYPPNWSIIDSEQDTGAIRIMSGSHAAELGNLSVSTNTDIYFPIQEWIEEENNRIEQLNNDPDNHFPYKFPPVEYLGETTMFGVPTYIISKMGGTGVDTGRYIYYIFEKNYQLYAVGFEMIGNYGTASDYLAAEPSSFKQYQKIISTLKFWE